MQRGVDHVGVARSQGIAVERVKRRVGAPFEAESGLGRHGDLGRGGAGAEMPDDDLVVLRIGRELFHGAEGGVLAGGKDERIGQEDAHRLERLVGKVRDADHVADQRHVEHERADGVSVARRLGDAHRAGEGTAAAAGPVHDRRWHAVGFLEFVGDHPGQDVFEIPGRERHNEFDRLLRIFRQRRLAAGEDGGNSRGGHQCFL